MSRYYSYETIRDNAKDVTLESGVKHRCIDPDALLDIEPADVRENVRGEWINKGFMVAECSNCKEQFHELEIANFCPNCGADMRGDNNGKRNDS